MKRGVDYIGVGVGAAIFDRQGRLFLTLRGPGAKNERGKWEIPGGGVEFGETLEDALMREMEEEHGIAIRIVDLLGVCSHIIRDEHQHWVSPTYVCTLVSGSPVIKEPHKCAEIGWFTLEEARKLPLSIVTLHDFTEIDRRLKNGWDPAKL